LSRTVASLLIVLTLVALGFFPQGTHTAAGFFAGSLLVVAVGVLLLQYTPGGAMPLGWQLGAYTLLCGLATLYSPYWMRSWIKFSWTAGGLLMFYFSWRTVRDLRLLRTLLWWVAAVAILVALVSLWREWRLPSSELARQVAASQAYSGEGREDLLYTLSTQRIRGPFGNPNHLAGFLVACSAPLLLEILRGEKWKRRILALLGFLPIAWVLWRAQSRSGFLTLILALLILGIGSFSELRKNIFHWKLSPLKVVALLLLLILLAFAFGESWVVLSRVGTIKTRIEYSKVALELIRQAPLLGHGLDSFALYYPGFHRLGHGEAQYVHNWPLEVWVEMGLVGLAVFIWLILSIYRLFNQRLNDAQDPHEERALLALMSGTSVILLQSLFDFNADVAAIYLYLCFFLGCLAGITAAARAQADLRPGLWSRRSLRAIAGAGLLLYWVFAVALPFQAESNHALGLALAMSPDAQPLEAMPYLKQATTLNPFDAEYHNSLGNHYLRIGQPRQAAQALEKSTRLNPLKPRNHFDLYHAYRELGRLEEALQELQSAHRLHPTDDRYLAELARLHEEAGDHEQATLYWNQARVNLEGAIQANPNKADYHHRLAAVLDALGRREEAQAHRDRARQILQELFEQLDLNLPAVEASPRAAAASRYR